MTKPYSKLIGALMIALFATTASAKDTVQDPQPTGTSCTKDTFAITAAGLSGTPQQTLPGAIQATSCIGIYATPNNLGTYNVEAPNLGYLGNGLLNGEKNSAGVAIVSPTQFITSSQLQDLNPNTNGAIDPGWVQLGTLASNSGTMTTMNVTPTGGTAFNLSNVLSYTQTVTDSTNGGGLTGGIAGTWTLTVNPNIVNILHEKGLFQRSSFDQLAFELKAGSNWAVYDFDFTKIGGFDLTKPYTISGTFNLNDFRNPTNNADQNISLLSVWARDPVNVNEVPEPGTLAVFGAGLLSLAALRRRQRK